MRRPRTVGRVRGVSAHSRLFFLPAPPSSAICNMALRAVGSIHAMSVQPHGTFEPQLVHLSPPTCPSRSLSCCCTSCRCGPVFEACLPAIALQIRESLAYQKPQKAQARVSCPEALQVCSDRLGGVGGAGR